tara:strand:- start:165 stop:392 length:228 start_codon:yes stop_codon:yes gene_type:complete
MIHTTQLLIIFLFGYAMGDGNTTCDVPDKYIEYGEGLLAISLFSLFIASYSIFLSWQNYKKIRHVYHPILNTRFS